ncbi:MAG: DUF4192 domain-containing protein [Aeromicrobium sp.]
MTQPPSVYTAHDIPDLLNALPTLFGFRPRESLVAVATYGPRRRFGFRLRLDLPEPEHVDEVGRLVAGHLRHQGAEGAILVAVTRQQDVALDLLDAIHAELDEIDLIVRARTDGERYWTDEPGFPDDGIEYETSDHHLAIVQAVAAGQEILPDRQALVDRFAPPTGERLRWLDHAADDILDELLPQLATATPETVVDAGMAVLGPIIDRSAAGESISDADLLRFAAWVSSIRVRDAVWTRITRDNAADMLRLLAHVSRSVVDPFEPAVLSLAAFAAWLTGDGAQALIAVERAIEADPEYSMAHLMLDVLQRAVPPSSWTGFTAGVDESP